MDKHSSSEGSRCSSRILLRSASSDETAWSLAAIAGEGCCDLITARMNSAMVLGMVARISVSTARPYVLFTSRQYSSQRSKNVLYRSERWRDVALEYSLIAS